MQVGTRSGTSSIVAREVSGQQDGHARDIGCSDDFS